jgi:FMN reductase [NAD(P)H]
MKMEEKTADRGIFDILKRRATCRSFKPDSIPDEAMEKLLDAACTSASSGGFQRISVILVKDAAKKKRLAELSRGQNFLARAPVHFVFCADRRRMRRIAEYEISPCEPGDSIASLWMGIVDATIAAQSVALAAEALGLRSCYNGNIVDTPREMARLLRLPEGVVPVIMLTVGYPVSQNGRLSRKYPARVLVHEEEYRDLPMEELYAEHLRKFPETYPLDDGRRERLHRAALAQGGAEFAARCVEKADAAGKLTACQFWFGCYYHDEEREEADAGAYLDYLAENGFDVSGKRK